MSTYKKRYEAVFLPNNSKFIEVASSTSSSERFFEGDQYAPDIITIPYRAENAVCEPKTQIP